MTIPIKLDRIVLDNRARGWCKLPYPDHPRGCPNYNHKPTCPPQVCSIERFLDLTKPVWAVVEPFDLSAHIEHMRLALPNWSERQLRCVLYWQGGVNKRLEQGCHELISEVGGVYTICPEAMGVDVIHTIKQTGLPIRPRPDGWVFKVGLVGSRAV